MTRLPDDSVAPSGVGAGPAGAAQAGAAAGQAAGAAQAGAAAGQAARAGVAVDELRMQGERVTPARRAVIDALASLPGHPTAEQVVTAVEAETSVHRATVYRALEALTAAGVVTHVHVGHGATSYHLAEQSHLHAQCGSCGTVIDMPEQLLAPLRAELLERHGFALDASHMALSGLCRSCRSAGVRPLPPP